MSELLVSHVAQLLSRANMSASYKPALLKALARITRVSDDLCVPLEAIGREFAKMYWNQTVIFHLRQAASLTKEAEVIKAVRAAAEQHKVRYYNDLPELARDDLEKRMARILTLNVLSAFHTSRPPGMPLLYEWNLKQSYVLLSAESQALLRHQSMALEAIANYHWADFLEATNRLAPRIIQKVKRDGARRRSLAPFLSVLKNDCEDRCFYCSRPFSDTVRPTVDHVIPWSFLVDDPIWDLVLACAACNASKSDILPDESFIEKLIERNARRAAATLPALTNALVTGDEVIRLYNAAISVEWPRTWAPSS